MGQHRAGRPRPHVPDPAGTGSPGVVPEPVLTYAAAGAGLHCPPARPISIRASGEDTGETARVVRCGSGRPLPEAPLTHAPPPPAARAWTARPAGLPSARATVPTDPRRARPPVALHSDAGDERGRLDRPARPARRRPERPPTSSSRPRTTARPGSASATTPTAVRPDRRHRLHGHATGSATAWPATSAPTPSPTSSRTSAAASPAVTQPAPGPGRGRSRAGRGGPAGRPRGVPGPGAGGHRGRLRRGRRAGPRVQRAAATFRWTGSWHTVFVTADRLGGGAVDDDVRGRSCGPAIEPFRMAGYDLEVDAARRSCRSTSSCTSASAPACFRVPGAGRRRSTCCPPASAPTARRGFFHPDRFTFAQPVYLSAIVAAAQQVDGRRVGRGGPLPAATTAATGRVGPRQRRAADGPARDRPAGQRPELPRARGAGRDRGRRDVSDAPPAARAAPAPAAAATGVADRTPRARRQPGRASARSPTGSAPRPTSGRR